MDSIGTFYLVFCTGGIEVKFNAIISFEGVQPAQRAGVVLINLQQCLDLQI